MKLIKWKIRWRREKEDRGNCVPSEMLHKPRAWNEELSTQDPPTTRSITQPIYWGYPTCNPSTAAAAKLLQLCPTLCDPIDSSPPGSPGPGILQPRTLEWVAISFSNAWKWKVKVKSLSHVRLLAGPEGVLICNLPVEGDSGGSMAGRRTSVLVFFEERIQQRD